VLLKGELESRDMSTIPIVLPGVVGYSDPLIDCTSDKRYSWWMKGGVSWTTKGIANRRLKDGLPGVKRI
jgi:hypothetical protein